MTLLLALTFNFSFAQEKSVSGVVSDDKGLPIPGVNVIVRGTQNGVQTDFDGKYTITVNTGDVLEFSFLGFKNQTVTVGAQSSYNVSLEIAATEIDAAVIDVYRSTTVRKSPAAISTLSIEAIEDRANASVLQNLQGQVAGLNIATGSGQPGADSTIILRGVGTINGNVEPLFVVDGVPVDEDGFRTVNQNDIATVRVLKDAAATSIYGNRGANGVVVITTKRGSFDQPLEFRYSSQFGFSELQPLNIDLMNSRERLQYERMYGVGAGAGLTDAQIDVLANQTNTYWTDIFFRTGVTKSHDLAITSGSANSTNFTSLSYFEQDGIFINTNLKRFTVRNNFNGKSANNKFQYGLNLNLGFSKQSGIDGAGTNQTFFAPFSAAMRSLPYLSPYDANGDITRDGGLALGDPDALNRENVPYILLNSSLMNIDQEDELKVLASFNSSYNFAKNLTAGVQIGLDYLDSTNKFILHPQSLLGPFQSANSNLAEFGGAQFENTSRDFRFNALTSLNYNNTFAEAHTVDFTVYTEYNKAHFDGIGFDQRGLDPRIVGTDAAFIPGTTIEPIGGDDAHPYIPTLTSFKVQEGLFSYFANLDYDYKGKYGVSATIRRDASFRFIDEYKWGTFWSLGGYWNIDEESFMDDSAINQLRLRASYGTSGNQRINNAAYSALNRTRSLYGVGASYNGSPSTVPTQLANVDLQWETTAQTNIGIDFAIWNNKLEGSLDVYRKLTTDLFQDTPISPINGTPSIDANFGSLENKGIEAQLKYMIYDTEDWDISINANGSYNKNKIRDIPAANGISDISDPTALVEGEAIGSFFVQRFAGVNPATGNALFYAADGSLTETMTDADRYRTGKSIYPVWQGGFGSGIKYKGFEFNTQWVFFADIYRNNLDYGNLVDTNVAYDGFNRSTDVFRAWQNPGDITDIPRVNSPYDFIDYVNGSDRFVEDASYLRLRNVSFGYSFNKKQLEKLPITGLRFFVQGENLVTFSSYRGWDAEGGFRASDRGHYPTPKIYTLGAVVNF
jgi:TonB-linked SusC/RagA family outer membrane protein